MRIIIDTRSGLSLAEQAQDLATLDAVVIGEGEIPQQIGRSDGDTLWVKPGALQSFLGGGERPAPGLAGVIAAARRRGDLQRTAAGEQLRIRISRTLP